MSRHNLTDREWNSIRGFLPAEHSCKAGRPWKSHRQVINGILFVLCTGIGWSDLPAEFGRPKTVANRFRRWVKEGLWHRIVSELIDRLVSEGEIDFELWCVDGTVVRAHRAASGAPKEGLTTEESAEKQALGRSRGGYSSKIHLMTDGQKKFLRRHLWQKSLLASRLRERIRRRFLRRHFSQKRPGVPRLPRLPSLTCWRQTQVYFLETGFQKLRRGNLAQRYFAQTPLAKIVAHFAALRLRVRIRICDDALRYFGRMRHFAQTPLAKPVLGCPAFPVAPI